MKYFFPTFLFLLFVLMLSSFKAHENNNISKPELKNNKSEKRPNVIFFVVDDLNDWINPLNYKDAITPNLDRLAKSGVVFSNAHCPGVFCAPSRTAIFTGLHASTTGCYADDVFHYDHPDLITLQMSFKEGGYNTYGAGKLYHHMPGFIDLRGWDKYFTRSNEVIQMGYQMNPYWMNDNPLPEPFPYWHTKTNEDVDAIKNTPGYLEWGPVANDKEEQMAEVIRTNWACKIINSEYDKPFFLGLGLFCPHLPNYVPERYFDLYKRDSIQLPPMNESDLDDLPANIQKKMLQYKKHYKRLEQLGLVKDALHAYLAATSFADAMLGRILDALENSPNKDNTIVIFWSDNGYHHGEKGRWGKHTLWQRTTNIPFFWMGPGIAKGAKVNTPVSLIDIYPTLTELCRLPENPQLEGVSLAPILNDPSKSVDRNVLVPHMERGAYAIVNSEWRYINYGDGTEELYNVIMDPNEWNNLAEIKKFDSIKQKMKQSAPLEFAPRVHTRDELKLIIEGNSFHWEKK